MPELFESFDNGGDVKQKDRLLNSLPEGWQGINTQCQTSDKTLIEIPAGIPFEETIEGQTGWKRPYPYAICQDPEIFESVTVFTYDIHDDEFVDYFDSRTCWSLKKATPYTDASPELLARRKKLLAAEATTPIEPSWIQRTKAQLQDCWELYKKE